MHSAIGYDIVFVWLWHVSRFSNIASYEWVYLYPKILLHGQITLLLLGFFCISCTPELSIVIGRSRQVHNQSDNTTETTEEHSMTELWVYTTDSIIIIDSILFTIINTIPSLMHPYKWLQISEINAWSTQIDCL